MKPREERRGTAPRIDEDINVPLRGSSAQLGAQLLSEVIGRNHGTL
jgi:hypothetical protein